MVKIDQYNNHTNTDAHPIESMRNSLKGYFYLECLYWKIFLWTANMIYKIRSYFFYPIHPGRNDSTVKNAMDFFKWLL